VMQSSMSGAPNVFGRLRDPVPARPRALRKMSGLSTRHGAGPNVVVDSANRG
jgi:hypothetical protein